MGGVCALIGEAFSLAGGEGAVPVQPCYDMEAYGMAYPVGYEGLLAGAVNADAAPAYLSAAPCAKGLVEGVLLVAEAAAYIGLSACPTTRRIIWGIWVEATTVSLPFSSYAKQPWFSMWQCCTVGVSYQPSTLIRPGSFIASA